MRDQYIDRGFRDLADAIAGLIDLDDPRPQGDRIVAGAPQSQACLAPGERLPATSLSLLDTLLLAAADPVVASALGLLHVYVPRPLRGPKFDYRAVGVWPAGTRWSLLEGVDFDGDLPLRRFPNVAAIGDIIAIGRLRATLVSRPSRLFGMTRALSFAPIDDRDLDLPDELVATVLDGPHAVELRLPAAVAELQLWVGERSGHVVAQALDDAGQALGAPVASTWHEDVLCFSAAIDRPIRTIRVTAPAFWLFRIRWSIDPIEPGRHVGCAFGLAIGPPAAFRGPHPVAAVLRRGTVHRPPICEDQPPLDARDDRVMFEVKWPAADPDAAIAAVRYHVVRIHGDRRTTITAGEPQLAATDAHDTVTCLDRGLVAGEDYSYAVSGIDIFGRESELGPPSDPVRAGLQPPPAPEVVSAGFDEDARATRIRWSWSESLAQANPDDVKFRLHWIAGVPNTLSASVVAWNDQTRTASLKIATGSAVAAAALVGRMIAQADRRFRIADHPAAEPVDGTVTLDVRLADAVSGNQPAVGKRTVIRLDANLPIELHHLYSNNNRLVAAVKLLGIAAAPVSLVGSTLRVASVECTVIRVLELAFAGTIGSGVFELRPAATVDLGIVHWPMMCALRVTDATTFVDLALPASWDRLGASDVAMSEPGEYEVEIRAKHDGELAELRQTAPRKLTLTLDAPLAALEPSAAQTRCDAAFGVSTIGPGGQSAVRGPAQVVRYFDGAIDGARLAPWSAQPPLAALYASAPDAYGKSVVFDPPLQWPISPGWTYSVYRALDESIFAADAMHRPTRPRLEADHLYLRTATNQAQWGAIVDQVITPAVLDRTQFDRPGSDVLLQALASMTGNEDAFTRLGAEPEMSGDQASFQDLVDGRAAARYLYRIRATNTIASTSKLGFATQPVHVRGVERRPAPTWRSLFALADGIRLTWIDPPGAVPATSYRIWRTEDLAAAADPDSMTPVATLDVANCRAKLRVEAGIVASRGIAGVTGVFGAGDDQNYFVSQRPDGSVTVRPGIADGTEVTLELTDVAGAAQRVDTIPGAFEWTDSGTTPGTLYYYRVQAWAAPIAGLQRAVAPSEMRSTRARYLTEAPVPVLDGGNGAPIIVRWPGVPANAEVRVQRRRADSPTWSALDDWHADAQLVDDTAQAGVSYLYRLVVKYAARLTRPSDAAGPRRR